MLAATAFAEFSPLSIHPEGFGMPLAEMGARERGMGEAGMAALSSQGYFLPNPSRSAFFDRTSFIATLETDLDWLRDDNTSNRMTSAAVPTIATAVKTRKFGALGLHFQQAFQRRFSLSTSDSGVNREFAYEGGLYLLGFSWAYSPVPFLALGFAENLALGRDRIIETATFPSSIPPENESLTGDTLEMRHSGSFPAFSLTVHTRLIDAALAYTLATDFDTHRERRITGMASNPMASESHSWPSTAALGLAWRATARQTLALDFSTVGWKGDSVINRSYKTGLGYEWRGSGNPYEDYYKRMAFRAGLGQEILYLQAIPEYFGTMGVGLPLGPRGHTLDISVKVGHRSFNGNTFFSEDYVKLSASVVGVGVWGQPVRKRH